jgi:hypothetical protein
VIEIILKLDLEGLLRGVSLDLAKVPPDKYQVVAHMAAHCIFNGPVGVNKNTNFPTGEVGSIKALIGVAVTNSGWREFCRTLASELVKVDGVGAIILKSAAAKRLGKIWPL